MKGKSMAKRSLVWLKRNRSDILTAASLIGVLATVVTSAHAAIKAEEILRNHPDISTAEKVKKVAPVLIPPVIAVGATITVISVNHSANKKANAALASAYTFMVGKLAKERSECPDEPEPLPISVLSDICVNSPEKDDQLFYDEFSERYFWSTQEKVSDAEYFLNRLFILQGTATPNDFYRLLKIPEIDGFDEFGWDAYLGETYFGYSWVDFEHIDHEFEDPDTPPCTEIFMPFYPHTFDENVLMEGIYDPVAKEKRRPPTPICHATP